LIRLEVKHFRSSLHVFAEVHPYHRLLPVTVAVSTLLAPLFVRLYDLTLLRIKVLAVCLIFFVLCFDSREEKKMSDKQMHASERHVGGMVASELGGSSIKGYTEEDRKDMWRMGKKQELRHVFVLFHCALVTDCVHCRRNFRFISTVGYATCVYGTWEIYLT
jgi:hypothetical protein